MSDWRDDPVELARVQAWEDAKGDGTVYRVLLRDRGIQYPMMGPIMGESRVLIDPVESSRSDTPEAQHPMIHP